MSYESNTRKMYLFRFLRSMSFFSAVLVPFLSDWGGLNFQQILLLQSWFMLSSFLLEVPTGVIADKWGRKTSIALACIVNLAGIFLYSSTPDFRVFMLAEFLWATSNALVSGADKALMYDSLKQIKRERQAKHVYANYAVASTLAFIFAGPIGSFIAKYFPLNYPMLFTSIPVFLSFLVIMTVKEPGTKKKLDEMKYFRMGVDGVKYLVKHPKLRKLALNHALFILVAYYLLWLWQPLSEKAGIDILYYGFVMVGMDLTGIFMTKKSYKLEDWFGRKKALIILGLIPPLLFILTALTNSVLIILPAICLIMGARQSRRPLMESYMQEHIQSHNRATVNSAISMSSTLLVMVVNVFFGAVVDYSLDAALIILGVFGIIFNLISRPEA